MHPQRGDKLDKTFDEAISEVRNAERGVEVREALAQGFELSLIHIWYPSKGGRAPILQTEDTISAALANGLTIQCEGGAILLDKDGKDWAQPLNNTPEGYLCEYLIFELTRLIP